MHHSIVAPLQFVLVISELIVRVISTPLPESWPLPAPSKDIERELGSGQLPDALQSRASPALTVYLPLSESTPQSLVQPLLPSQIMVSEQHGPTGRRRAGRGKIKARDDRDTNSYLGLAIHCNKGRAASGGCSMLHKQSKRGQQ